MDISMYSVLYESVITTQQINYLLLEDDYLVAQSAIGEADESRVAQIGAWIKSKLDDFITLLKKWVGYIITFFSETLPNWISKAINKILRIFRLKKDADVIETSGMSEEEVKEVKTICKEVNNVVAEVAATVDLEPAPELVPPVMQQTVTPDPVEEKPAAPDPVEEKPAAPKVDTRHMSKSKRREMNRPKSKKSPEELKKINEQKAFVVQKLDKKEKETKNPKVVKAIQKAKKAVHSNNMVVVDKFKEAEQKFKANLIDMEFYNTAVNEYLRIYDMLNKEYETFVNNKFKSEHDPYPKFTEMKKAAVDKGYTKQGLLEHRKEQEFTFEMLDSRCKTLDAKKAEYRKKAKDVEKVTKGYTKGLEAAKKGADANTKENIKRMINTCQQFQKAVGQCMNEVVDLTVGILQDAMKAYGTNKPVTESGYLDMIEMI